MKIKDKGFSLIEMAIVLVIFGLVLASASSILTLFVNRGGAEKTRQMMVSDKNALVSSAQSAKELPFTETEFRNVVSYPVDSYNKDFFYYADENLNKIKLAFPANTDFQNINVICGSSSTNIEVWVCKNSTCADNETDRTKIGNIAFVIASGGENKIIQTSENSNIIKVYPQGADAIADKDDANTKMKYDDIVDWMSLDELRSKVGCDGESIKFSNQALPYVKSGNGEVKIYAAGGIPLDQTYNGAHIAEYMWNVEKSSDNNNEDIDNKGSFSVDRNGSYYDLLTSTSTFEHGKFLKISCNNTPAGQYLVNVKVKDRLGTSYSRTFILNVSE